MLPKERDKEVFESSLRKGDSKILAVKNNMIRTNHVILSNLWAVQNCNILDFIAILIIL